MTRDDIAAVIKKVPGLNAFGIGYFCELRGKPREVREAWFKANQDELLNDVDGCTRAETWLEGRVKTKTASNDLSSYSLKHRAEKEVGYITNGAFIAAAIHLGFPYRIHPDSPNVGFGISKRSLRGKVRA